MKKKKKNQLPSGRFRVQVLDYIDDAGKKHYKSFTAASRTEAEMMASDYRAHKDAPYTALTVKSAVKKYLDIKKAVLSPTTMRGYVSLVKNYFGGDFSRMALGSVDSTAAQIWVSELAAELSPKTVRNAYGLFSAAFSMFRPGVPLSVKLPQKERPELYCPSDADIRALLDAITDPELKLAVMLAAFGTMRRGEVCALTGGDFDGNGVSINKAVALDETGQWQVKAPKTYSSYRYVSLPAFVLEAVRALHRAPDEPIFTADADLISCRFQHAVIKAGLPHFRFHDLRHYSASILHAIGVPDQYILQRGGWSSDHIMKTVYRNTITDEAKKQDIRIQEHFQNFV